MSRENANSNNDAIGRGRKGYAHGSIVYKTVTRTRKSGKVCEYQQAWYQWQDKSGKHSRYLSRQKAEEVQRMLDEGAIVPQILEHLGLIPYRKIDDTEI